MRRLNSPTTERPPDEPPPQWDGERLDFEQVDSTLKDAIEELKPEYREVLLMWGVEGLKYREIAAILDVSVPRVHQLKSSALEKLRLGPVSAEAD